MHRRLSARHGRRKVWDVAVDIGVMEDGRRKQYWKRGFPTKDAAERHLSDVLTRYAQGTLVQPTKETLATYLRRWLPAIRATLRPSTWESYERNITSHVIPRIGHVYLQRLTPALLNTMYADLLDHGRLDGRGGLSVKTTRYIHTILHRALGDAVRWSVIARNMADQADPPRPRLKKEMKTWTAEELRTFLAFIRRDSLYPAFLLVATTGMRRGELLGLRWRDIDFEAARASIRQTVVTVRHTVVFSEPKTARGRRSVAIDSATIAALREHRKRHLEERLAVGAVYEDLDLVFAREDGRPLHPESFVKVFDRRVTKSRVPRIRFHDLRHTYATLSLAAGVHPKVVSERLGHGGIAITMDTYSHAIPALQEEAAETVARLILGPSTA